MKRFVIRHGEYEKGPGWWGKPQDAPLTQEALQQARRLGKKRDVFDKVARYIAASETLRAQTTAAALGPKKINPYARLNEVPSEIPEDELKKMLAAGHVPDEALEAGELLLANPPAEAIWVSHGLTIAGLTAVVRLREGLSLSGYSLLPENLEIRELEI